jgi:hypothetical protein
VASEFELELESHVASVAPSRAEDIA